MANWFSRIARGAATASGHYLAFIVALGIVVVWAGTGPIFQYSSTWQLLINTSTTIVTFLMVFLLQNSQNHDSEALHVKLDEIINAITDADDRIMAAEDDTEEELESLKRKYNALAKK